MIIRIIESEEKRISSVNLDSVYMLRAAERVLIHLPSITVAHTGIWGTQSFIGELTLGDIFLGQVQLSSFAFSCQMFSGQPFTLHSLFHDIDFNPFLVFNKDEPVSFLFRSRYLHFNLSQTIIEKTEPDGHILNKGYFIKEVIMTKRKLEVLG